MVAEDEHFLEAFMKPRIVVRLEFGFVFNAPSLTVFIRFDGIEHALRPLDLSVAHVRCRFLFRFKCTFHLIWMF